MWMHAKTIINILDIHQNVAVRPEKMQWKLVMEYTMFLIIKQIQSNIIF